MHRPPHKLVMNPKLGQSNLVYQAYRSAQKMLYTVQMFCQLSFTARGLFVTRFCTQNSLMVANIGSDSYNYDDLGRPPGYIWLFYFLIMLKAQF